MTTAQSAHDMKNTLQHEGRWEVVFQEEESEAERLEEEEEEEEEQRGHIYSGGARQASQEATDISVGACHWPMVALGPQWLLQPWLTAIPATLDKFIPRLLQLQLAPPPCRNGSSSWPSLPYKLGVGGAL